MSNDRKTFKRDRAIHLLSGEGITFPALKPYSRNHKDKQGEI